MGRGALRRSVGLINSLALCDYPLAMKCCHRILNMEHDPLNVEENLLSPLLVHLGEEEFNHL